MQEDNAGLARKITDVKSPLYHACGAALYRILPETESDQVQVSGYDMNLTAYLEKIDRALGGNTSMRFCPNIASRDSLGGILAGDRVFVMDASADPELNGEKLGAMYIMLPTMQWQRIGKDAPFRIEDFVKAGFGLSVDENGQLVLVPGAGLGLDENGALKIETGSGVGLDEKGALKVEAGDGLGVDENGALKVEAGSGLGVDENGALKVEAGSGLGMKEGAVYNLAPMFNTEEIITESGDYTAPVSGWYFGIMYPGGCGAIAQPNTDGGVTGGHSSLPTNFFVFLEKGQVVPVVIGAGGVGNVGTSSTKMFHGGDTSFGDIVAGQKSWLLAQAQFSTLAVNSVMYSFGAGHGGGGGGYPSGYNNQADRNRSCNANGHYGAGGGAIIQILGSGRLYGVGDGAPGCVILRYFDPEKTGEDAEETGEKAEEKEN